MKTENKLIYKAIMYLLLFLCAACISFHLTVYGVQSEQELQDSQLVTVNNEYNISGDGNNNSIIHKIISNILKGIQANNKSGLLSFISGALCIIVLFIHACETYLYEHNYFSKLYKKSLIVQKIRLDH